MTKIENIRELLKTGLNKFVKEPDGAMPKIREKLEDSKYMKNLFGHDYNKDDPEYLEIIRTIDQIFGPPVRIMTERICLLSLIWLRLQK